MHKFLLTLLLVTWITSSWISAQDLQFYREEILFRLDGEKIQTEAVYYFCNIGPEKIRVRLFYPFPGDDLEFVDSLIIADGRTEMPVTYERSGRGIFFEVSLDPYGQAAYRVYFRQSLQDDHYRYILTSTYAWGRPFESALYRLYVPAGFNVDSLSMVPDSIYLQGDHRI